MDKLQEIIRSKKQKNLVLTLADHLQDESALHAVFIRPRRLA